MRFFRRLSPFAPVWHPSQLSPEQPFCVVGDIHGRADLVLRIADLIARDYPGITTIFVGDLIDRGDQSAEVLDLMMANSTCSEQPIVCLKGNHEEMCLSFLGDPTGPGRNWLRHGGLQTLASYGVAPVHPGSDDEDLMAAGEELKERMGEATVDWLARRPLFWTSGNVLVSHAGANPSRSIKSQKEKDLVWGHPDFYWMPRRDGRWVIHGHTVHANVTLEAGRIATDTGAYATGRLGGVFVEKGRARSFHVEADLI